MAQGEREQRHAHDAELTCSYGGRRIVGNTVNLSRGGLCALLGEPLVVGTDLTLELALVFGDGGYSEPLSLWGRIVWCTALDERFQVGMAFVNVGKEALEYLEMFLRYLAKGAAVRDAG